MPNALMPRKWVAAAICVLFADHRMWQLSQSLATTFVMCGSVHAWRCGPESAVHCCKHVQHKLQFQRFAVLWFCRTGLAVAPDKSAVVSVGSEGGIFIWEYAHPEASAGASEDAELQQQMQHVAVK